MTTIENNKIDLQNADLDTVSKRLKFIIKEAGIKQSHMAKKLGITKGAVSYILNSDVKNSKNAKRLAKELNINEKWLLTGQGDMFESNEINSNSICSNYFNQSNLQEHLVPVYYIEQMQFLNSKEPDNFIAPIGHVVSQNIYRDKKFAICLTNNIAAPKFEIGDKIIFVSDSTLEINDWLLVHHISTNQYIFAQAIHIHDQKALLICGNNPPLEIDLTIDKLLGVYVECIKMAI